MSAFTAGFMLCLAGWQAEKKYTGWAMFSLVVCIINLLLWVTK